MIMSDPGGAGKMPVRRFAEKVLAWTSDRNLSIRRRVHPHYPLRFLAIHDVADVERLIHETLTDGFIDRASWAD